MVITEDVMLSSDGRVTIPKRIREQLDLEAGERLRFVATADGALAVRRTNETVAHLREVRDRLESLDVDFEDVHRRSASEWHALESADESG